MTSFQSALGEDEGVADELAANQRQISIAEFFEKNKHMLGFDSGARGLVTAVKEGVDNSLVWETPFVYRDNGETKHEPIGAMVDRLIEQHREDVTVERGGDLEKVRVGGVEALSFNDEYDVGFQSVGTVFRHRVNSDIYKLSVEGGRGVRLTDYHSVFVLRDGDIVSVKTSEITEDDHVVLPQNSWGEGSRSEIDLVTELLDRPAARTEPVGLYGVEHLIEEYRESIRESVDAGYRLGDFKKCDRLPLNLVRELDLDPSEYRGCELGYRYGKYRIPAVLDVDSELAELLGLYTAEGCVTGGAESDHEKVYLSLGSHETELISRAESLVKSVFGIPPSTVRAHDSATNVTVSSKITALVIKDVFQPGVSADEKRIPRFVFDFPQDAREQFLLGYAAGDGHPTEAALTALKRGGNIDSVPKRRFSVSTVSDRLASGIRYLLSSVGYDATHEVIPAETRTIDGRDIEFGDSHKLYIRTNQSSVSRSRLPASECISSVEDAKLAYNLDGRQTRVATDSALALADGGSLDFIDGAREVAESDLTALPVESIKQVEYNRKWVYDISVPGDENFMAGTAPLACHNSLDACEEAGIAPDIFVDISEAGDYYKLVIEDNGPGITKQQVPKVFGKLLYGSRFHAREQNRGQQGIGISAAVLYSQLTSGKPARVTSRPKGKSTAQEFELIIDTDANAPEIKEERERSWDRPHGTRIELEMEANMRARSQLHDYIEETAVVNPHARVELREPGLAEPLKFERATDELHGETEEIMPDETEEIKPHPHGVELGTLIKMLEATESYSLSGFLQGEFTRVGTKSAASIVDGFRDRFYGREVGWSAPAADDPIHLERAVETVVANKGKEATEDFAGRVADTLESRERTTHAGVVEIVDTVADEIATAYDTTFGDTVREKAVEAAWACLTAYGTELAVPAAADSREPASSRSDGDEPASGKSDGDEPAGSKSNGDEPASDEPAAVDLLTPDLYTIVDDATTTQKDDAVVNGVAERLARRLHEVGGRHRVTRSELRALVGDAADDTEEYDGATFGETARENVTEAVWERTQTVPDDPPKVGAVAGDRDTASELLAAMRAADVISPPTNCLAPITEELVEAGLRKEFDADFYAAATRDAEVSGGDPFIVEAGIAYGGELEDGGQVDVLRFANRVPLVYQRGACATTDVVKRIGWRNYGLSQSGGSGVPQGPAVVMVHIASTNVPFTSESKDAVANVPEIEDEIELAIREAARELKSFLNERRSLRKRREKQDVLGRILPEMAEKVAEVTDREEPEIGGALARIMNNVAVETERDGDETTLAVRNHTDTEESPDVTAICATEPAATPPAATAVEVDGEWFLNWQPTVAGGETEQVTFELPADADVTLSVDAVAEEKLTLEEDE